MRSRATAAGHAMHPMLVVFPLGLLTTSLVFDVLRIATDDARYAETAFFCIAAGLLGGVAAAVTGFLDLSAVPKGTRAKRIGSLHAYGNDVFLGLFLVSWLLRLGQHHHVATGLALALSVIGVAISGATGWLGGELVERLGVSVTPGAHVDAPSSLETPEVIDLRDRSDSGARIR